MALRNIKWKTDHLLPEYIHVHVITGVPAWLCNLQYYTVDYCTVLLFSNSTGNVTFQSVISKLVDLLGLQSSRMHQYWSRLNICSVLYLSWTSKCWSLSLLGEKLSKQQLQHSNIIKKLRVKEKESDTKTIKQQKKIKEQEDELRQLQQVSFLVHT